MVRAIILGAGFVGAHLAVGLERIKAGKVKPYGIPLANIRLPYKVEDIEIVGVYDVDASKIGRSLHEIAKEVFGNDYPVPEKLKELKIRKGLHLGSLTGLSAKVSGIEEEVGLKKAIDKLVEEWGALKPDVIVNVITTEKCSAFKELSRLEDAIGSERRDDISATQAYAYATAKYAERYGKGIAFVNTIPATIANDPAFVELYERTGAVVFGDDGATGATPFTADVLEHLAQRNRYVKFVVQFNIGGNTDFLALSHPERNKMKEITKSSIVADILGYDAPHYIKPTGYLEPLGDKKYVAMHIEYISFNGFVDEIYVNARINDSPALAGMIVDLIRLGKIAADKGVKGTSYIVNAFFMKMPGPKDAKSISKILAYYKLLDWLGVELVR
jgi:myo-inositol-1-phosphate synthase